MSSLPNTSYMSQPNWKSFVYNKHKPDWCSILYLSITSSDPKLKELYETHVSEHNKKLLSDTYFNSGFDLFVPNESVVNGGSVSTMVSMKVKCEMQTVEGNPLSYYMYPRSSISKTPLMLANHVGIIDSGYRGELIGAFRNLGGLDAPYTIPAHTRLLQVCHPELKPIYVRIIEESDLSNTERGQGGFGSTGK